MTRALYRWNTETHQLEELTEREPVARVEIMGDSYYDGLSSPIDGSDISTRRRHREHMKIHGVTLADDMKGVWAKARKERDDYYSGKSTKHEAAVEKAVDRAWHTVINRRRGR